MIRRVHKASLLVALVLLASASTAYAECAWVLWRNDSSKPVEGQPGYVWLEKWRVVEAFTGMGATMGSAMAQRKCEERRKQMVLTSPEKSATEYSCLPDTVDPRAPKGK